jgi:hypothetical protein
MPDEPMRDELGEYLRGDSAVSHQYQRDSSLVPPLELDQLVLKAAGCLPAKTPFRPRSLAPLAYAASVFLSLALLLAMLFGPQVKKPDDKPHVVRVRIFNSEPPRATPASPRERNPVLWLEDINALRRAGRGNEADVEMRRFRSAYPDYIIPISE